MMYGTKIIILKDFLTMFLFPSWQSHWLLFPWIDLFCLHYDQGVIFFLEITARTQQTNIKRLLFQLWKCCLMFRSIKFFCNFWWSCCCCEHLESVLDRDFVHQQVSCNWAWKMADSEQKKPEDTQQNGDGAKDGAKDGATGGEQQAAAKGPPVLHEAGFHHHVVPTERSGALNVYVQV